MNSEWNLSTVKEFFERILAERELRYAQMFKSSETAVSAALAAQEKAVQAAFESSEKAIVKAEVAQQLYNVRSNEFRATLDDQAKMLLTRSEADVRFQQLKDLIDAQAKAIVILQRGESRTEGGSTAESNAKSQSQWVIVLVVTIGLSLLGGIGTLVFYLATKSS